jgi:uncharacterized protein
VGRLAFLLLPALLTLGCGSETAAPPAAPVAANTVEAPISTPTPAYPALTGRVVDDANLLTAAQEDELTGRLATLEQRTTDQLVVVTVPSLGGLRIADYTRALGNHWGIGRGDLDNGVLLVLAPNEREVRIEVGTGLRQVLTNELAARVIDNDILPQLRAGDIYPGISGGVEALIATLTARRQEPQNAT